MTILVTGGAGFIGSAVAARLGQEGHTIIIIDNFNPYYDTKLKRSRIKNLVPDVPVYEIDITDKAALRALCLMYQFDAVCHLAAQAGVRYSVEAPEVYLETNIIGTQVVLEVMRETGIRHMVLASTSSVYGTNTPIPFTELAPADKPVSVYAATKRSAELLAYNYYVQYGITTTCLRFFTVYGPWSRPDMAMHKFAEKIQADEPIELYNHGRLRRDFTYIEDIVTGFVSAVLKPLGYEIINLGNGSPVELLNFVEVLETALGKKSKRSFVPMQAGDVFETYADITKAKVLLNFSPQTDFETGVQRFVDWFVAYHTEGPELCA